jgi:hypothetical protein
MITETEDDIIITDTKCKIFSDYAIFHLQNIGCQWIERATGKIFDKGIMFSKFNKNKEILKSLTRNCQLDFDRIKKKDYLCGNECSSKLKQLLRSAELY